MKNYVRGRYVPLPLIEYFADLAEFLGCERPGDTLELFTTTDCEEAVSSRLAAAGFGRVEVRDLLRVVHAFGSVGDLPEDINGDGMVSVPDLLSVIQNFGPCP